MMREWYSAAELAALRLPGLGATARSVQQLAVRQAWAREDWKGQRWRPRQGRGGGAEYHYTVLPAAARKALLDGQSAATAEAAKAATQGARVQRAMAALEAITALLLEAGAEPEDTPAVELAAIRALEAALKRRKRALRGKTGRP